MQKADPKKTKLALKLSAVILAGALLAVVILLTVQQDNVPAAASVTFQSGASYQLETVSKSADLARGLGGRSGLSPKTGMLFVYDDGVQQRCIWMKDMKFSIDVVWVNDQNRITSIVPDMAPASYPQDYCAVANRVVELPAGTAKRESLRAGQTVRL